MSINVTLFAQMLVFGLLGWFTMTFVWPLIREAMEEREQKITDGLAAAEKGQSDLQQAGVETEKIIGHARDQARDILSKANSRANDIVEEARSEGEVEKRTPWGGRCASGFLTFLTFSHPRCSSHTGFG